MFCEDDETIERFIRMTMRSTPHEIRTAPDGLQGLALIQRLLPDLVVTDISMPGLDGFGVADAMHANPATAGIPILFATASVQRTQVEQLIAHGAAGYIGKPFGAAELRAKIEQHLPKEHTA
ncbi:MAG: diguanylate cyclase [Chloroflexota bacterium]|nr:diguanylate cyclase [Chloroflexota bacterium]